MERAHYEVDEKNRYRVETPGHQGWPRTARPDLSSFFNSSPVPALPYSGETVFQEVADDLTSARQKNLIYKASVRSILGPTGAKDPNETLGSNAREVSTVYRRASRS